MNPHKGTPVSKPLGFFLLSVWLAAVAVNGLFPNEPLVSWCAGIVAGMATGYAIGRHDA